MLEHDQTLLGRPFSFLFGWIQMIQPSLPALLGSSEKLFFGEEIEVLRNFIPFYVLIFVSG